ncbi:hypothetical protein CEP54_014648 [Fusarium duplospermum]|uniref:Uncharacterized protein n=1 Tax=Fusarium duplospermum TaxID=1325734 RepID=A0A428NUQ8_9HYPO|nr:hypothetical protein CEP54_014648 [Fusarium duplospermum]
MKMDAIKELEQTLWRVLLSVETRSGQTGAPALNAQDNQQNDYSTDWEKLAVDALSVMQIAPLAEDHAKALLLTIERMRKILDTLDDATQLGRGDCIRQSGQMSQRSCDFCQTIRK